VKRESVEGSVCDPLQRTPSRCRQSIVRWQAHGKRCAKCILDRGEICGLESTEEHEAGFAGPASGSGSQPNIFTLDQDLIVLVHGHAYETGLVMAGLPDTTVPV